MPGSGGFSRASGSVPRIVDGNALRSVLDVRVFSFGEMFLAFCR